MREKQMMIKQSIIKWYLIILLTFVSMAVLNNTAILTVCAQGEEEITINTAEELLAFAARVNAGDNCALCTVTLENDINLNGVNWIPIGNYTTEHTEIMFSGTFDGKNHKITGLEINNEENYQGLFGYNAGSIKNLKVKASVQGTSYLGVIAGYNAGTIENVIAQGNVTGKSNLGGIAGYLGGTQILNAKNYATVLGNQTASTYVAGITGYAKANSKLEQCRNYGDITVQQPEGNVSGASNFVAGITGYSLAGATIKNCYNQGTIKGHLGVVAGIAGYCLGPIENCYNAGEIKSLSTSTTVKTTGGIVAYLMGAGTINNSYNVGKITTENGNCGGIAGSGTAAKITNCYYLEESAPYAVCSIKTETGKMTETEMKTDSFAETLGEGFKKDELGINASYPVLVWQMEDETPKIELDETMEISLSQNSYVYDGTAKTPEVTIEGLVKTDYKVTYSNNINAGTAIVTIEGIGNYSGILTKDFTITKLVLSDKMQVSLSSSSYVYDGKAKTPEVTIEGLVKTDYKVTYIDNINTGKAKVTIEGIGNYSGTLTKYFTITKLALSDKMQVSLSTSSYTYNGKAKTPKVTIKGLTSNDYKVEYSKNINPGTAIVKVIGCGNYQGTLTKTFTIKKAKQTISASSFTKTYGEKDFSLKATTSGNGNLTYKSNSSSIAKVDSSTGKITLKGYGKATITITAAETSKYLKEVKTISITVKPAKMYLTKITSSKKKIELKWNKDSKATGYQIRYTQKADLTKAIAVKIKSNKTLSKTIKELKVGKKYYVQIRAYKTISGKTYYGDWSKAKSITIKK